MVHDLPMVSPTWNPKRCTTVLIQVYEELNELCCTRRSWDLSKKKTNVWFFTAPKCYEKSFLVSRAARTKIAFLQDNRSVLAGIKVLLICRSINWASLLFRTWSKLNAHVLVIGVSTTLEIYPDILEFWRCTPQVPWNRNVMLYASSFYLYNEIKTAWVAKVEENGYWHACRKTLMILYPENRFQLSCW